MTGQGRLRTTSAAPALVLLLAVWLIAGCALVRPERHLDETTPIDAGLSVESAESAVTVPPFDARDEKWGAYAAERMGEFLLEHGAFDRVVVGPAASPDTPYVLEGDLEYLSYGGTHSPSRVCVSVRIVDTSDGSTRFLRVSRASSQNKAFHVWRLGRHYLRSDYPEELLNALLGHIAEDIAERTASPAQQRP